jgi:hypothetical protein
VTFDPSTCDGSSTPEKATRPEWIVWHDRFGAHKYREALRCLTYDGENDGFYEYTSRIDRRSYAIRTMQAKLMHDARTASLVALRRRAATWKLSTDCGSAFLAAMCLPVLCFGAAVLLAGEPGTGLRGATLTLLGALGLVCVVPGWHRERSRWDATLRPYQYEVVRAEAIFYTEDELEQIRFLSSSRSYRVGGKYQWAFPTRSPRRWT